jgi:hypothetical protein
MMVRVAGKFTWGLQLVDTSDGRRIDMPKEQLDSLIDEGRITPGRFSKGKVFVILPKKTG